MGAGPLVIGRGAAFASFATEGCRALRADGFEVVAVDSNASSTLTDPGTADRAYIEPLTPDCVARIVERERPRAILPTLGGPAALELALALGDDGVLGRLDVEVIGADLAVLRRDPDRAPRESVTRGKRFELAILCDARRSVVVCVIESLDPAGVHPGDSIAVTPAQTLTREDERALREIAVAAVREAGVTAGAAHVEIALSPRDGRPIVVAVHPTLARGSAFASMASGVPMARIAARLAVGSTLDEAGLAGGDGPGRCAVKIPRWAFDEFPEADRTLTGAMQSVGEAMAIGRTFKDALQKALRALDERARALTLGRAVDARELTRLLAVPTPERIFAIAEACRLRRPTAEVHALTGIDGWFLEQVRELAAYEDVIAERALDEPPVLRRAKRWGFADARIAELTGESERRIRALRLHHGITPAFAPVGARGLYSTYDADAGAAPPRERPGVVVLGSGPHRIGHGADLHHGREQAAAALGARGLDPVVIDANPEAASTAGRVYLEPLTPEDVLNVVERERPRGVIVQFAGASSLARALADAGVAILGTPVDAIEGAEDRERLDALVAELGLRRVVGAPAGSPGQPRAVDTLLEDAIPVDVDALADGRRVFVAGVMEHVEKAGVHGGDAACALPPYSLGPEEVERLHRHTAALGRALGIVGLFGVRYALKNDAVYVLGVDPRASRTVPFVSKAIGVPLARLATDLALGDPLPAIVVPPGGAVAVREAVFPFRSFPGVDVALGPGMRSTGEVMGLGPDFRRAYLKSQLAAGARLPTAGRVWISSRSCDRRPLVMLAKRLGHLGFTVVAAGDTARVLRRHGMLVERSAPGPDEGAHVVELMRSGQIALVIDLPEDGPARARSAPARRAALDADVPSYTTLDGAQAVLGALEVLLDRVVARAA